MDIEIKKIVLKKLFLKKLPYIKGWHKDQIFVSKLIKKKIFLNKYDQNTLLEYFNIRNKHWSTWSGESGFDIWVLFTNPESCEIFNKELIEKARLNIIPYLTKWYVGDLDKYIKEYAKENKKFNELYIKRISDKTYFQRNFRYLTNSEKLIEKIRIKLYKNKIFRKFYNKYILKYDIE